jgi:hypoxanthine phosphoribosyltransferase
MAKSIPEMREPKVLISEVKIRNRVRDLAQEITHDYKGKDLVVICVLKGSFIFFADLIRQIDLPIHCEFMGLSSYGGGTHSTGEVKITLDLTEVVNGKHVLIVEDIVDSGLTVQYLMATLKTRRPASIRTAALLMKPDSIKSDVDVDYVGFEIGNEFVIGYGLDYAGRYRQLPFVGVLDQQN